MFKVESIGLVTREQRILKPDAVAILRCNFRDD